MTGSKARCTPEICHGGDEVAMKMHGRIPLKRASPTNNAVPKESEVRIYPSGLIETSFTTG